jgi:hypothetical protein
VIASLFISGCLPYHTWNSVFAIWFPKLAERSRLAGRDARKLLPAGALGFGYLLREIDSAPGARVFLLPLERC